MDIGKVGNNVINMVDHNSTQKKAQEQTVPQSDVILDLHTDKSEKNQELVTYTNPMNATNKQLWEQYSKFTNKQIGKQLGSIKSYIQGFMDGSPNKIVDVEELENMLWEKYGIDGDLNPVHVKDGGKYSAENLSDTFVQFAKNLSGGDSSKADLLLDAVKKGFEIAKEAWGGELPEISQQTYDLTVEKFDAWKNEDAE